MVFTFDIEEHDRIEAAAQCVLSPGYRLQYRLRMAVATHYLLDALEQWGGSATFFVVGQIAKTHRQLVRMIGDRGHEVASHSWAHRRLHTMSPEEFRSDLRLSKDALEQATGHAVVGYRAPTFSLVRSTAWAIDILGEEGFLYDSSIYPVRHDRYGVPEAPAEPFWLKGRGLSLLEIPPASLSIGPWRVPIGGGGYFRLLPGPVFRVALRGIRQPTVGPSTVLYFHPWEFDSTQPRLPLSSLHRWRTYVGIRHTRGRLNRLLATIDPKNCLRMSDLASRLLAQRSLLSTFELPWAVAGST